MINWIKQLFCKHSNNEVVCWHWIYDADKNETRYVEIQRKCNDCGKYYFTYMNNWDECYKFIEEYRDKMWSATCNPVL